MKILVLAFPVLLCATGLFAQRDANTLLGDLSVTGAFGGPLVEIGNVAGVEGANVGGGGALVARDFFFGGYGIGGTYDNVAVVFDTEAELYDVRFKHGGLWFGYAPGSLKLIHPYTSFKFGWGKARLQKEGFDTIKDRFFILEPELGLELNITDFLRIAVTGNYRAVSGINSLADLTNKDFNTFFAGITFRIGGFDNDNDFYHHD